MLTDRLTKNLDEQIGAPVDNLWLVREAWSGIHHSQHFNDALDLVEASIPTIGHDEALERGLARFQRLCVRAMVGGYENWGRQGIFPLDKGLLYW